MTAKQKAGIIETIITRDSEPPMTPKAYRGWLETLNDDDLREYLQLVKKCHPLKKS